MKLKRLTSILSVAMIPFSHTTIISPKRICRDCKFFIANNQRCAMFGETNIVTGKVTHDYASSVRLSDKCGEEGKYFVKNNFRFVTAPYYFVKEYSPFICFAFIYSVVLAQLFK